MNSATAFSDTSRLAPTSGGSRRAFAEPVDAGALAESRLARRIASRLDQSANELPHDLSERLRFARELALQKARLSRVAEAAASSSSPSRGRVSPASGASVGSAGRAGSARSSGIKRWWFRAAAVVPLLALVGGLVVIQRLHVTAQIKAAADIDAALLADDLPPAAYADPAFAEFLKAPRD